MVSDKSSQWLNWLIGSGPGTKGNVYLELIRTELIRLSGCVWTGDLFKVEVHILVAFDPSAKKFNFLWV